MYYYIVLYTIATINIVSQFLDSHLYGRGFFCETHSCHIGPQNIARRNRIYPLLLQADSGLLCTLSQTLGEFLTVCPARYFTFDIIFLRKVSKRTAININILDSAHRLHLSIYFNSAHCPEFLTLIYVFCLGVGSWKQKLDVENDV